jgi:hypothetical protein
MSKYARAAILTAWERLSISNITWSYFLIILLLETESDGKYRVQEAAWYKRGRANRLECNFRKLVRISLEIFSRSRPEIEAPGSFQPLSFRIETSRIVAFSLESGKERKIFQHRYRWSENRNFAVFQSHLSFISKIIVLFKNIYLRFFNYLKTKSSDLALDRPAL